MKSKFSLEFQGVTRNWKFWLRVHGSPEFKTEEEAEAWVRDPENQVQFAGDTCYPQGVVRTRVRIVEWKELKKFLIGG